MSRRAWAAFAAASTLWGIPYLFIKVAVDDGVPPAFLAWLRVVMGAAVLLVLAKRAGVLDGLRGRWRWIALFALCEITIPFPMIAAGEERVASSLAAIVIATVPLLVAVLAVRLDPTQRVTRERLVGLLVGLAGVMALVGIDVAGRPEEMLGAGMVLLAALGYAIGPLIIGRKLPDVDPRATMGASLAVATIMLSLPAALDTPDAMPSAATTGSILVLGLLCTAAGFLVYGVLLAEVGAGRAVVITYVNPVVAVALGVSILGERPGPGAVVGLLLILAGSWLSTDGRLPPGLARALARRRGGPAAAPAPDARPLSEPG